VFTTVASNIKLNAQSMTITPSTAAVAVGGTSGVFTIKAVNPPATNSFQLRINIPTSIAEFVSFTDPAGFIALGVCSGSSKFTPGQICVDAAKTSGNITNGETLGTFTLKWIANGTANIPFVTGNAFGDSPSTRSPFTGNGATVTVGAGGNLVNPPIEGPTIQVLPSTSLDFSLPNAMYFIGFGLLLFGISLKFYPKE